MKIGLRIALLPITIMLLAPSLALKNIEVVQAHQAHQSHLSQGFVRFVAAPGDSLTVYKLWSADSDAIAVIPDGTQPFILNTGMNGWVPIIGFETNGVPVEIIGFVSADYLVKAPSNAVGMRFH